MKRQIISVIVVTLLLSMNVFGQISLEKGFKNPPASAKARTWWHWVNGNVSKEGITADLEAMKEAGIQEAQLFNVEGGIPDGNATYMTNEWLDMFYFAANEADRLGIELGFHNSAGWSSSGGPWVTPELSMQTIVYSDTVCIGGKKLNLHLHQPTTRFNYYRDIAVVAFPKPQNDMRISDLDSKSLAGRLRNKLEPTSRLVPQTAIIKQVDIVDLTTQMSPEGILQWKAPAGEWVILRMGHTPTGAMNRPAPKGGCGLEIDKMNQTAVDQYWQKGIVPILNRLGHLVGKTVKNCIIDSYEVGCTNYTEGFDKEFYRLRGYNFRKYLPVLAGYYVDSGEVSERFLWDLRRTIGDLITKNYYGRFRDLCHKYGMMFSLEPYWGPFNSLEVGDTGDIVMCEFWSGNLFFNDSPRIASSAAHLNGKSIVGSESFTGNVNWLEHPATIKGLGDRAWTNGITRLIFHTYAHQPWNMGPGLPMGGCGLEFNRLNTWWKPGKAFLDYIARSQFLLQQGSTIADVLVFIGESSPNDATTMPEITSSGFDYDLIGPSKMMTLTAKAGVIHTQTGGTYRLLVLPQTDWMTPEILAKIEELVRNGVRVIGPRPKKSPSLNNYPACDDIVEQIAEKLWGKGLIQDSSVEEVLKEDSFIPDFTTERMLTADIGYTHRRDKDTDIYLVDNMRKSYLEERCNFRVTGKRPELWNPETGEIRDIAIWKENGNGTITIPLQFESDEALFVLFRKPAISENRPIDTHVEVEKGSAKQLPGLKIIKAEYGTFLPAGLVDVTQELSRQIRDGKVDVRASFTDAAPGYIKELRIAYKLNGKYTEAYLSENELLPLQASSNDGLEIISAVYGKFDKGLHGIPPYYSAENVTEKIQAQIAAGTFSIHVDKTLASNNSSKPLKGALRVTYSVDGEQFTTTAYDGETLFFSEVSPETRVVVNHGKYIWLTPYAGKLHYITSAGEKKSVTAKAVASPLVLTGKWDVTFPLLSKEEKRHATFDVLTSWTNSTDEQIRYFSGTATYRKKITIPPKWVKNNYLLELDLGDVRVMAEVIINGKPLGVLWKAPFRIDLGDTVRPGINELELRITNLWPNALIGDEQYAADIKWQNGNIQVWPEWLDTPSSRNSKRKTFTTRKIWDKNSPLLPSGLLGPVLVRPYQCVKIE